MNDRLKEIPPVERALTFIHDNAYQNIKINDIARHVNLSPSHLAHIFKKQTNFAPLEYTIKLRLEHAMILLAHSNKTVTQIADEIGYSSPIPFINIFKRKTGYSPSEYRKIQMNDEVKKQILHSELKQN